ncbi:MAG: thiolase domain-containing protein [Thermoplasmata archaeon]
MTGAHVTGTGVATFGKRPDGLVDLLVEAATEALSAVGRKSIDLIVVGTMLSSAVAEEENVVAQVSDRLGLETAAGLRVEAASATGAATFQAGVMAVRSGAAGRVLTVAGEKMTGPPTAEIAHVLSRSLAPSEQAVGASMPGLAALVARLYLDQFGGGASAFDHVAQQARTAAALNPKAQFQTPVTLDEVATSRPIALPLRLLHCSAVTDGAAAAIVERGAGEIEVAGFGQGLDHQMLVDRVDLTSFLATRTAAQRAFEMAKITRKEIDFAELHDAFAPFALIDLEDIGMCGAGEAASWFSDGRTGPEGRFPVNASGGLLGRGHPVGASGLVQIVEIARQLRKEAGPFQLAKDLKMGLAQSIGGLGSHNFVTILRRGDAAG